jgi:hypothetical protein
VSVKDCITMNQGTFPGFVNFGREGKLHIGALCEDPEGHSGYSSG